MQLIIHVHVIQADHIIKDGAILIDNGTIQQVYARTDDALSAHPDCTIIDGQYRYASSGFIDLHVHGGGGYDVMSGRSVDIIQMAQAHSRFGTTSILPTTLAAPIPQLINCIDAVRQAQAQCTSAHILGVHLEGPYFAPSQRGAQNADHLLNPDPRDYLPLIDHWDGIRIMGAAPELPGALALGDNLKRRGIMASIAHSDATYDQCIQARDHGYTDVTHIYSGCSSVIRRNAYRIAGVVEAGLVMDDLTVQVITDGKHLPAALLKLIYKVKGPNRIALISDGLSFAAFDAVDGQTYTQSNGIEVIYEDGVMKLPHRQAFAGSTATSNRLVRNMIQLAEVPLVDAVKMATTTPAKMLNLKTKGHMAVGYDADIILFDEDIHVSITMVNGSIVYNEDTLI